MKKTNKIFKGFNGCVSIKKNGKVMFQEAFGYADLPNKIKNTLDAKFATASAGKTFVAVAILQLIEKGRLKFDDTIGKFLKFSLGKIDKEVTIEQLLNHTSGVPDYFDETKMDDYAILWKNFPNYKIRKSSDLLPLFINEPMMYPKGKKFQYNNSGYVLLDLVIENIAKMPFDKYLKKNIFQPTGMKNTGYYELDRLPAKCTNAYILDKKTKEYYTNIYSVDAKGTGAGGAFTTVLDIDKFWKALLGGKLIGEEMIDKMCSVQSKDKEDQYGFGVWMHKTDRKNIYVPAMEGCDPGICFISYYDLYKKFSITIVSNFTFDVWTMKDKILLKMKS